MGHRPFSELVGKMSPKAQEEIKRDTTAMLAELEIGELRGKLEVTQAVLAGRMKTTQAAISRLEKQTNNTKLSTLQNYAKALGGELDVRVALPRGETIRLKNVVKAAGLRAVTLERKGTMRATAAKVPKRRRARRHAHTVHATAG